MKAKGSLYEVLKAATAGPAATPGTGPSAPPEPPPSSGDGSRPQTLKDRLAAYKAKKLAAINQTVAEATPPPPVAEVPAAAAAPAAPAPEPAPEPAAPSFMAPTILVSPPPAEAPAPEEPEPAVPPSVPEPVEPEPEAAAPEAPAPEAAPPKRGPGERVIRLTYNTAAFAALVVVGMVFLAYALGVQSGRARTAAPTDTPAPAAAAPAAPVKHYSLLLAEWPTSGARDRLQAQYAADQLSRTVRRAGLGKPRIETHQRGNQAYLVLYMGETTDPLSDENRKKLSLLRRLKVGDTQPFKKAGFEERSRR